jgi:hypothetical protein
MTTNPRQLSLTLDLVPYVVTRSVHELRVHGIGGSILANLDNRVEVTGNRFSEDKHVQVRIPRSRWADEWYWVVVEDREDGTKDLVLTGRWRCNGVYPILGAIMVQGYPPSLGGLVLWISENYDAIQSIGYECLEAA